ncbi:hypothetical protein B0H16DRAFT_1448647 [Mycena metata]|uniref:Uncharacterized protein n=1 Tax=Mycena metata TaxID=1033252 RepID=A0AAD7K6E2_9AGAR|nr:hypothetical protein B0H16DRAFT_1448647 [Mycena metata]
MSRLPSPDDEESQYNEGRGLLFSAEFTALPPPPPPGKKARVNAKAPKPKKHMFYVHESSELNDMLHGAIRSIGRETGDDQLAFSWNPRDGTYTSSTIDIPGMTYTILKSDFKDISLCNADDYTVLLEAAQKKVVPEMIKIFMTEIKLSPGPNDNNDREEEEEEEEEGQ